MITLHTMPRLAWGGLSPSPFCVKVEVYLRMVHLPYTRADTLSLAGSPKQKLPWIEDGGRVLGDSEVIVAHLIDRAGDPLGEAAVPAAIRARDHVIRRTVEESLYFALVSERWRDEATLAAYTQDLLAGFPAPARPVIRYMARRNLLQQLWQQGYGRHTLADTTARGIADLDALANLLGELPYFGGAAPRAIDASVYGSLANLWEIPVETALKRGVGAHPNLVGFVERMSASFAGTP